MLEAWQRALRNCVMQVPDESNLDYEPGQMALKPLEDLFVALTPEQVVALAWFALAEVAVWPQVPGDQGPKIADALDQHQKVDFGPAGAPREQSSVGRKAAEKLLELVIAAEKHLLDPSAPAAPAGTLQQVFNEIAKLSDDPDRYWREWFLRVVPAAAFIAPLDARKLAVAAFRCTLKSVAPRWDYEAGLKADPAADGVHPGVIAVVTPTRGGTELYDVGLISNYEPQGRKIDAVLDPLTPIDSYRMGYLFQTIFMAYFLLDSYSGRYDSVMCTNKKTGERWNYPAP
ncbi:MAG TPA: hypothetical protein VFU02_21525 [Polyangiaceae bacterium]|nr:hypothetical protein [Polyangiaceae bacterium]